jgi:Rrf2 family transcriptional regulator, iron-sulfur cluster assembly transcription factor
MLSQTAEYAVRAALYLGAPDRYGRAVPAEAIATALGAPANYMSKTLHQLAKAGIVAGQRGPTGGFRLAVAPSRLTVARIVATFDSPALKPMCLLGDRPCDSRRPCDAHHQWTEMTQAMRAPLAATTIASLLQSGKG